MMAASPAPQQGTKKRTVHPLQVLLSVFAAFLVYEAGKLAALFLMQVAGDQLRVEWSAGLASLLAQLVSGGICCAVWKWEIRWRPGRMAPQAGRSLPCRAAAFLGLAVSVTLGLNLLLSLIRLPGFSEGFQETAAAQAAVPVWLGVLLYGAAAPFSEEVLFRGIVYTKMKLMGVRAAMLFSSLLFGVYHGNLVQAVYGFLLGLLLSYIYERTGTLLAPVCFHGAGNLAVYLLIDVWHPGEELAPVPGAAACVELFSVALLCFVFCFGIPQRRKNREKG